MHFRLTSSLDRWRIDDLGWPWSAISLHTCTAVCLLIQPAGSACKVTTISSHINNNNYYYYCADTVQLRNVWRRWKLCHKTCSAMAVFWRPTLSSSALTSASCFEVSHSWSSTFPLSASAALSRWQRSCTSCALSANWRRQTTKQRVFQFTNLLHTYHLSAQTTRDYITVSVEPPLLLLSRPLANLGSTFSKLLRKIWGRFLILGQSLTGKH